MPRYDDESPSRSRRHHASYEAPEGRGYRQDIGRQSYGGRDRRDEESSFYSTGSVYGRDLDDPYESEGRFGRQDYPERAPYAQGRGNEGYYARRPEARPSGRGSFRGSPRGGVYGGASGGQYLDEGRYISGSSGGGGRSGYGQGYGRGEDYGEDSRSSGRGYGQWEHGYGERADRYGRPYEERYGRDEREYGRYGYGSSSAREEEPEGRYRPRYAQEEYEGRRPQDPYDQRYEQRLDEAYRNRGDAGQRSANENAFEGPRPGRRGSSVGETFRAERREYGFEQDEDLGDGDSARFDRGRNRDDQSELSAQNQSAGGSETVTGPSTISGQATGAPVSASGSKQQNRPNENTETSTDMAGASPKRPGKSSAPAKGTSPNGTARANRTNGSEKSTS